jgi:hypothetical protein
VITAAATHPSERLNQANPKCRQADVEIYLNKQGELEMFFPLKGMLPCTEDIVFRQKWFPMPESFPLPQQLIKQLGPGASTTIPSGQYPITKVKGGYIISF